MSGHEERKQAMINALHRVYVRRVPEITQELAARWNGGRWEGASLTEVIQELRDRARTLHHSSATLGLERFAHACRHLEQTLDAALEGAATEPATKQRISTALEEVMAAAEAAQADQDVAVQPSAPDLVHDRPRILVVDDVELLRTQLRMALTRAGFDVDEAADGASALAAARAQRPDLILLDVMMPGMDGFDVQKHVRADETLRDVPIIFLSALRQVEPEQLRAASQRGFQELIVKPKPTRYLIDRVVSALLEPTQSGEPQPLTTRTPKGRLLLVEPVDGMRQIMATGLRAEGYAVDEAADEAGLEVAIRARWPDLILLDASWPAGDGFAVLRRLRADERLRGVAVVLLVDDEHLIRLPQAIDEGIQGYVLKPTTRRRIVETIEQSVAVV